MRAVFTAIIIGLLIDSAIAQQGALTFEVVSIRPNQSAERRSNIAIQPGGRVVWTNVTVHSLIGASHQRSGFDNREIIGGPDWLDSARFDVVAQAPAGTALTDADGFPGPLLQMVRAMLLERFQLVLHEEQRDRPVYTLELARADGTLGPRLKRSTIDCAAIMRDAGAGRRPPVLSSGRPPCAMGGPPGQFASDGLELAFLANALSGLVGRPVLDRTGLTGAFDWDTEFSPDSIQPNPNNDPALPGVPSDQPSIFTALREHLGLKLEVARAPVSVLVIDRLERPTAN